MPEIQNFVFLLLGGLCLIVLAVIAVRFFAALKTSHWTAAQANIVTSEPRRRRAGEPGPETQAHILYEFTVDGKTHRSHQLKARGVPVGETELPHFLGTYPVGSTATIYYNPANPQESVLEREPLKLSAERLGCLGGFVAVVVLAMAFGLKPLHELIMRWFPNADNENVLVIASALGVFLILFGVMWLWQGIRERHWPTAAGTIVTSKVESFKALSGGSGGTKTPVTMFRAAVVYKYEAEGRTYQSSQVRREKISGAEQGAEAAAAKYPAGSSVTVYYNPKNAADAVLETSATFGFIVLWAFALGMFAIAASVSGYFGQH